MNETPFVMVLAWRIECSIACLYKWVESVFSLKDFKYSQTERCFRSDRLFDSSNGRIKDQVRCLYTFSSDSMNIPSCTLKEGCRNTRVSKDLVILFASYYTTNSAH